jgi:hypothetical protein
MRINLVVPYMQRKKAKKMGAYWDGDRKTWFILTERVKPEKFWMWIDPTAPDYEPTEEELEAMIEAETEKLIGKMPKF